MYSENDSKTLKAVAFGFALACTIISGFCLIPLIWMIPMTIKTYHIYNGQDKNDSLAFAILSLIFLSTVTGILLLVDYFVAEDRNKSKVIDAKTTDDETK